MSSESESEAAGGGSAAVPWGCRTMVSPLLAGWSLLVRHGGILARGMKAGVPAAGEEKKKMDWVDEIRNASCSNDDDDGK